MTIRIQAIYESSYLHIISAITKQLGLHQLIDRMVPVDPQCQTRPSDIVLLLWLDIFSGRQALVHLEGWAHEMDLPKLIREGVQPSQFNDDAIARHLDRLYDAGIHSIVSECLLQIYQKERIPLRVFHADTTSFSLYGAYESASSKTLNITYGYSRDGRSTEKQIQFGLVGNEEGLPLYADVHDGNLSDKTWNPSVLSRVHEQLQRAKIEGEWVYVADSAAMTADTLREAKAAQALVITRGPNSLRMVKEALAQADSDQAVWSEPFSLAEKKGTSYRVWETSASYHGDPVRLIVVESEALDQRKERTFQKKRMKEAELLQNEQERWSRHPFSCREDAEKALSSFQKSLRLEFHRVQAVIEETVRPKKRRGRPKKGVEPETETLYTIRLDAGFDQEAWEKARRRASRFVLVTTVPTEWNGRLMDGKEILALYKGQISVEMNFSFLKDPFFTDEIDVKKPERVAVLGYLFLLALAIYRIFQRRVRQFVTPERPLKGAGGRKLTRPTGQAIFQLFAYVKVVVLELPDGQQQRSLGKPLTYEQRRILQGLGMDEGIYV
ncbi:transposase [Geobacillus thermocatenulatus]|uniref:IS1634 family transposase n=1 Tax=Geobacillus thermocatenulatus TaxID=33938 RepID=UPI000B9282A7|nr:IS1634 family transposase [Geobacillus thermocatenulatus]ASS99514.1 transposase [Geobacillus thermocatenulatus]ASS99772.1 transposase [Geobacillus thermocatenulatus]AST00361.1 transposase [Geobacillus thermocatenulatus]AST00370.1 transposase [Geobacillus thermocatenulatus]